MSADGVDAVVSDLRRAAVEGGLGDSLDRVPGMLVDAGAMSGADRFVPNPAPLAVAVDGPGLFVLQDGSSRVYSRLGDFQLDEHGYLVDRAGRAVVGFPEGHEVATAIAVSAADVASKRFTSYKIDERGVLYGVVHKPGSRWRKPIDVAVPIARLALAMFPVPERLARADQTTLTATSAAGVPLIVTPGNSGAGSLRSHVLAAAAVDIQGDLRKLWTLRRSGELAAALAGASDECTRTALGLVK